MLDKMLKKLCITLPFLLAGCAVNDPIAQKYPNAKYKISDKNTKLLIHKINNAEQCIHPKLKGLTYQQAEEQVYRHWSPAEELTWQIWIDHFLIPKELGEKNAEILLKDASSRDLYYAKHDLFNNQAANVDPVECEKFKVEFFDMLEVIELQVSHQ